MNPSDEHDVTSMDLLSMESEDGQDPLRSFFKMICFSHCGDVHKVSQGGGLLLCFDNARLALLFTGLEGDWNARTV